MELLSVLSKRYPIRIMNVKIGYSTALALLAFLDRATAAPMQTVTPAEAGKFIGKNVTVCGKIVAVAHEESTRVGATLLYLDKPPPDYVFYAEVPRWVQVPRVDKGKTICVTGDPESDRRDGGQKDRVEIFVSAADQVKVR